MHVSEPHYLMWLRILKLDLLVPTVVRSKLEVSDPRDIS
jgi:hypothetical protein